MLKRFLSAFLFLFFLSITYSQDSLRLAHFYNSTDGPNWINNTNWLSELPVSKWYGITVTDSNITSIKLPRNNLSGQLPEEIGQMIDLEILNLSDNNITTYSHTFHIVVNDIKKIYQLPENTNVHLKIDTGMHRNGISKNQLKEAIQGLSSQNLNLTGVMTHHRSADKLSCEYYWQRSEFKLIKEEVIKICEQLFLPLPMFHSCNSAALFRTANFDDDFARAGIATYGYIENDLAFDKIDLRPVLSLWGEKISTRVLRKNQAIGYGGTYKAYKNVTVSTYDIGYGDGFLRINENQHYQTPKGYKVLGRVSMDSLSLDSDDEKVCIFDDAKPLAKIHNTISYEIITTLSTELEREIK